MSDLDERLEQLALATQKQFGTAKGQVLLMQLWDTVYKSGNLYRPPKERLPSNYQDVYDDAVYRLMEYTLRNIGKYDPAKGTVMAWLNMLLDRRFLKDAIARANQAGDRTVHLTLTDLDDADQANRINAIEYEIEAMRARDTQLPLSEIIKRCLKEDHSDQMKQASMPKYTHINFQTIALRHHLDGKTFKDIADEFKVPYTSLVSFYQRRLKSFAELLKQCVDRHL